MTGPSPMTGTGTRPPVAVIVATKDRARFLPDCVASIADDLVDVDELVVAEAGDSRAPSVIARLERPAIYLEAPAGGKSKQLNAAVRQCANPIILFTDDDCRVPPGWVDAMTKPFRDDRAVAVAFGPVVGLTRVPGSIPAAGPSPGEAPEATWTYAHGASLAVRRSALVGCGGFDERLGPGAPAHGEEHDLLLRLREEGWRVVIAAAPPVQHLDWRDDEQNLVNALVYERGSGAFLGAALRRAPRRTWRLFKQRLGYQAGLFIDRPRCGRQFGARALGAFAGGVLYGVRLTPRLSPSASNDRSSPGLDLKAQPPSLWAISRSARASRPVFIVGEARSGTSLLYRLLQQHPTFAPPSLNLVESDAVLRLALLPRLDRRTADSLHSFLLCDEQAWEGFLRSIRPLSPMRPVTTAVTRRIGARFPLWWWATCGALTLRSFFWFAQRARGVRRVVDKTPQNTPFGRHLLLAFPHARLLYLSRHPVDVYSSYRRRSLVDGHAEWTRLSLGEFVERYAFMAGQALRFADRFPSAFMLVRYEELTQRLEETYERVLHFVGEAHDPKALLREVVDEGLVPYDPHLFGPVTETSKAWNDYIDEDEAFTIERRLAPLMAHLGYEPYVRRRDDDSGMGHR